MRHDESDEPDQAAEGHDRSRQQRGRGKDDALHPFDFDAQGTSGLFAKREQVQGTSLRHQDTHPENEIHGQDQHGLEIRTRERTHEPRVHSRGFIRVGQARKKQDERGKNRIQHHAAQQERVNRKTPVRHGNAVDDKERNQGSDKRTKRQHGETENGHAHAEQDRHGRTQRGAAGNADDVGIGQGIPK